MALHPDKDYKPLVALDGSQGNAEFSHDLRMVLSSTAVVIALIGGFTIISSLLGN